MPKVKFNVGDVVWVRWEDHYHDYTQGWQDIDDYNDDAYHCETVGYVIKDTPVRLYLADTITSAGQAFVAGRKFSGGASCKLKRCITDYKVLRKAK